jgi:predicted PurR-regulated permease PerM
VSAATPEPPQHAGGAPADESPSGRREALRWFARGVGFAAGALTIYLLASGLVAAARVLLLVFIALLLASALEPTVGRIRTRLQLPRGAAVLATYAAFFVSLLAIGLLLVPAVTDEVGKFGTTLPAALDQLRTLSRQLEPAALRGAVYALIDAARAAVAPGPPPTAGAVVSAGLTVADVVISVLTLLTLIYFWTTERSRLQRFGLSFLPAEHRSEVRDAWNDIEIRLGGWVRGQLSLMVIVGVSTGTVYALLGLPSAIALGLIAGLAEAIPLIGPALGAVPAVLVAATQKPDALIPVIIAYIAIQLIESNVLVPRIMRNAIGVSPFLILVSLLIGGSIAGIVGALVAVPCAAALVGILERVQDREAPVAQDAAGSGGPSRVETTDDGSDQSLECE